MRRQLLSSHERHIYSCKLESSNGVGLLEYHAVLVQPGKWLEGIGYLRFKGSEVCAAFWIFNESILLSDVTRAFGVKLADAQSYLGAGLRIAAELNDIREAKRVWAAYDMTKSFGIHPRMMDHTDAFGIACRMQNLRMLTLLRRLHPKIHHSTLQYFLSQGRPKTAKLIARWVGSKSSKTIEKLESEL